MPQDTILGFIGLGQMGTPMSANLAKAGYQLVVYDAATNAPNAPPDAKIAASSEDVAARTETIFLSLPAGDASGEVCARIAAAPSKRTNRIIDLSTIGPDAARLIHGEMEKAGIAYFDAPVSGGVNGAVAGTVTLMWSGPDGALDDVAPALSAIAGNIFHIGSSPGQGQAMKLLNNFLSATAMAVTSEAISFGIDQGIDMAKMLDVLNVSSGQNTATRDKFPDRVLTGSYDAGFATALMAKDVALYATAARANNSPTTLGAAIDTLWDNANKAMPNSDFSQIYEYVSGLKK